MTFRSYLRARRWGYCLACGKQMGFYSYRADPGWICSIDGCPRANLVVPPNALFLNILAILLGA